MSHNYLNKLRTQELVTTIKGYLSNISTVLTGLANGDARDNTKAPLSHNQASNTINAMTGYSKPSSSSAIAAADTLNQAIGKLEKGLDNKADTSVIPTVNNGTLTIQQNGTTKATFTANQAGNATVDIQTGDAYGIDMYDDTLPIDITARGDNLEDWVIYGNDEGVGQKTKNKVNTEGYDSKSNVVEITDIDTETGSIKATVSTSGSYASINYDAGLALENGKTYVFSCVVNVANSAAGLRIRNHNPASIQNSLMFGSTGYKETTFTISDDKYPTGAFMSVMITDSTTTTGSIDISNLMVREANTESGFTPYGYELPIITKQTGKVDITTNIYLGTSPLTEGQSLSNAQATTKDIPTYNGECTIDTSYPNKPRMEIIPTDSSINIIEKLRRIGASNGSSSTVRTIYAPDANNGIRTTVGNNRTEVQVACGQASNANARFIATQTGIQGGVGTANQNNPNYLFHDDCVEDKIGRIGSGIYAGKAQPGSTLDMWYETIRFNGKVMDMFAHSGQSHNAIWRGKYLGNTFTAAQKAAIADGSFDDLFVGDYWTINGVDWVIADIDYYYGFGDTECTTHHLVIVPRYQLLNAKMNTTNTTTGGYLGSEMKAITLLCDSTTASDTATVYGMICAAFGENNILSHSMYLTNAVDSSGNVSGWEWVDSKVDLLTQCQVFGEKIWSGGANDGFNTGIQNTQLAAFRLNHNFIINKPTSRAWYKLCDIWSATQFISVNSRGSAGALYASNSNGVRPHFCLF